MDDNTVENNSTDEKEHGKKNVNNNAPPVKQTNSETVSSHTPTPAGEQRPTNEKLNNTPVQIWINDAITTIKGVMRKKINVIFLDNLQYHAHRLANFLASKGTFDKDTNRVIAPHNRFYLKKDCLYFKIKTVKNPQCFDLATLLACVSFSKSKLFRFLQYRFKKVKAFSKNEKHCLHIFLNTCPISKRRIPCSSIRDLAKTWHIERKQTRHVFYIYSFLFQII